MGPFLRRFLVAALIAALAVSLALSLDLRPNREPEVGPVVAKVPPPSDGQIWAGAASVELTPSRPMPLGGFALQRRGRDFESVRDAVALRALALSTGPEEPPIVLLNIDTILVSDGLSRSIREAVSRISAVSGVVVTATHTHAGIGGTWDGRLASLAGMGRFDSEFTAFVVESAAESAARAVAGLTPAALTVERGEGPAICDSRRQGREADRRLSVARFDGEGGPVARIVIFACHPTFLGHGDARLSAEWPGEAARHMEGVTLVLQGAVGDQRPAGFRLRDLGLEDEPDLEVSTPEGRMVAAGRALAEAVHGLEASPAEAAVHGLEASPPEAVVHGLEASQAEAAIHGLEASPPEAAIQGASGASSHPLALFSVELTLPPATGDTVAPPLLRRLAGNLLSRAAPSRARLSLLRIGEERLLLVPAEVVSPLARKWESEEGVRVVSLADGYIGYLETAEALAERGGESSHVFFDESALQVVEEAVSALMAASAE